MYPYIHIVLPSYTLMAFVGGILALVFLYFRMDKYNIIFTDFLKYFLFCVIGCIVGSKILFAVTQIPWLIENFSVTNMLLLIPQSGFVFYGGLFGVIFTLLLLTQNNQEIRDNVFKFAVPAFPLFHAFGRIGCFLTGCCYGKEMNSSFVFWGMHFTKYPVQLIEACAEFVLFFVVLICEKNNKNNTLKIYLILYAFIRFSDEFLRGDEIRGLVLGFSTAQWISLTIIIYYLVKTIFNKKKNV